MTQLRILSDLHVEFGRFKQWPKDCQDVILLLPGDIGVGLMARNMIESMCKHYKAVVMTAGNHEYYHQNMAEVDMRFRKMAAHVDNFYYLQNETAFFGELRIIGGTMWTDLDKGDWFTTQRVRNGMNDFRVIKFFHSPELGNISMTTDHWRKLHADFRAFFDNEINRLWNGKTVVMTHMAPCALSVAEQYKGHPINGAYYEDMTSYMFGEKAPSLWCHGHMHNESDYQVGDCRIIANPRGYAGHELNPYFIPDLLIEL